MISVQMYDVDEFGRAIFCARGCVLFFPCPLRRLHLQNVHFEALALAPMFSSSWMPQSLVVRMTWLH
jgi:hypothetical protein